MDDIRARIFNNLSLNEKTVQFCGEEIIVVGMTVAMRNRIARDAINPDGTVNLGKILDKYPEIIIECARNRDTRGKIFQAADRDSILALPSVETDRIFNTAIQLSGLDAGYVENARKN